MFVNSIFYGLKKPRYVNNLFKKNMTKTLLTFFIVILFSSCKQKEKDERMQKLANIKDKLKKYTITKK